MCAQGAGHYFIIVRGGCDGKPPSVCAFLLYEFLDTPYEKAAIFALEREIGCFCFIIGHIILKFDM